MEDHMDIGRRRSFEAYDQVQTNWYKSALVNFENESL